MNMKKPPLGSIIYIQESVLAENVSLNYGSTNNDEIKNEDELIMLVINDKKIYLERFYG